MTDEEAEAQALAMVEAMRHPFQGSATGKRKYPGEVEASYLLAYLGSLTPSKKEAFLKPVRALMEVEQAILRKDVSAIIRLRKRMGKAYDTFSRAIEEKKWAAGVQENGLVVQPGTPHGKAALAVLLLDKQHRLSRIHQCHCGKGFYARFSHQQFCSKKCQESHYHTPEWRKKNRERNRKHQEAFRQRLFGKRR